MLDEQRQRQVWDRVAAGWREWWPTIDKATRHVSRRMIELADVQPGQAVLDVATGFGEPALLAARRVGPAGRVIATDLSPQMLAIGRERAQTLALTNVQFVEADMARLSFPDGSFDAVLCRWGLPSPPNRWAALVSIRRMLMRNGSFATAIWGEGTAGRAVAALAMTHAHEMFAGQSARAEPAPQPGSAKQRFEHEMIQTGFRDVRGEEMTVALEFSSAADCTRYLVDVSPELAALLSDKTSDQQAAYRQSLADKLRPYEATDGSVRIPSVTICAAGRR